MNIRLLGSILLLFAASALAQNNALQCQFNAAVTPTVRVEGLTELVGDVLLKCSGAQTPAAGQFYPQANISVTLNTTITSRIVGPGNATDAVLMIDDPAPGTQFLAPPNLTNIVSTGAAYNPSSARPNVFQGNLAAPNQLQFNGIPILAPDTAGTRIYRITNLRANAGQLGLNSNITGSVSMLNSSTFQPIPLTNPQQILGFVARGLDFSVTDKDSASSGVTSAQRFAIPRFAEGFPAAFKTRLLATSPSSPNASPIGQGVPGTITNSESGLLVDGGAGLVDRGTQFILNFDSVPPGTQIYVAGQNLATDGSQVARAVTSSTGPIQLAPLNSVGYQQIFPDANGKATAVWEVLKSDPNAKETFSVPIDIIYPGTPLAASRVIRVTGSLGPNPVFTSYLNAQSSFSSIFGFGPFDAGGTLRSPFDYLPLNSQPLAELRTTDTTKTGLIASFSQCQLRNEQAPFASFATSSCDGYIGSGNIRGTGLVPTVQAATQPGAPVPQSIPSGGKSGPAAASSWLTATLDQTATPARLLISADPTGLVPGIYNGRVTVTSVTAGVGQVQIPVTYTVRPTNVPKVISYGVTSAGSYANNVVSAGEAVVIFGVDFGPPALATLKLTNNVVDTVLGGTRVLFDGVPSPMIYAVTGQISCFVPFSVAGKTFVQMEVEQDGVKSDAVTIAVAPAVPAILTANLSGSGQGAVLNDDYSSNADHSALPGHYVFIYGTGAGQTSPAAQDGHLNPGTSTLVNTPVKVFLDGVELPSSAIQYAGPAPSLVEGVFQVNIKLPDDVRRGTIPVLIQFGSYFTQPGVTINTR